MKTQIIDVRTGNSETIRDITRDCAEFADAAADGGDGLLHVFVPHATAGIALIELGARSDEDLLAALAELLPADGRWRHAQHIMSWSVEIARGSQQIGVALRAPTWMTS